jgi:putative DNA primase/helicase
MNNTPIDKNSFISTASDFFNEIFEPAFISQRGSIEIRTFRPATQNFFNSAVEAAERAYQLFQQGIDVYFGVNPRIGNGGKKENVHYLSAFHAEIDYGSTGHKKSSPQESYDEALNAIQTFHLEPTIIIHSGGGFHCYWVLSNPVKVTDIGISVLENINKSLSQKLGGDPGTQDISRVLRIPGTFNFKIPDNPRPVSLISNTQQRYAYEDFLKFIPVETPVNKSVKMVQEIIIPDPQDEFSSCKSIGKGPIPDKIKRLIKYGNDGSYLSRSEADMAVITILVHRGYAEAEIKRLFQTETIGEKYRQHSYPDQYLKHTIEKAKERSSLTEEEMQDPLFISGTIGKNDRGYHLDILNFQEYMVKKYQLSISEGNFFTYNGKCYGTCPDDDLNCLCQKELGAHRKLFTKGLLKDFIHYAKGEAIVDNNKVREDQVNYLTLQNGLYSLKEECLLPHTSSIFTTNLLPYDYDLNAECPRFIMYLNEIFMNKTDVIEFVQEAVGYGFHKSIPMPAIFFLTGDGSNGKSVFINILTDLYGEENTCSISFNALSNEYYLLSLFGKMINISGETPQRKQVNTDMVKAVVAGDWVTGRTPYKPPTKFRPYAKHFLAMNSMPDIEDTSHGMWRRIYPVDFPRLFTNEDMDVDLPEKLSAELSGIFNWAMQGYKRLRSNKFRLKEVKSIESSKQQYKTESNNVLMFVTQLFERSKNKDDKVKFSYVYQLYQNFCYDEGIRDSHTKQRFRKLLLKEGFKTEKSTTDNNQVYVAGVKIINQE